jgi:hypothetical protein
MAHLFAKIKNKKTTSRQQKMGIQATFHAAHGGADFLGWRKTRSGSTEIIYDDGVARRMVWRVSDKDPSEARLSDALRVAVEALKVVPTLHDELKKRAIAIERVAG